MEVARGRLIRMGAAMGTGEVLVTAMPEEVLEKRFGREDLRTGLRARALPLLLLGRIIAPARSSALTCLDRLEARDRKVSIVLFERSLVAEGVTAKSRMRIDGSLGTV